MGTFHCVGWRERSRWFGSVLISLHTFYWLPGPKIMIVWSLYTYTDTDLCFTFKFKTLHASFEVSKDECRLLPLFCHLQPLDQYLSIFEFHSIISSIVHGVFKFQNDVLVWPRSWTLFLCQSKTHFADEFLKRFFLLKGPFHLHNSDCGMLSKSPFRASTWYCLYDDFSLVRHIKNQLVKKLRICIY